MLLAVLLVTVFLPLSGAPGTSSPAAAVAVASPTATRTASPTATATPSPTVTATASVTATGTPTATPTATFVPSSGGGVVWSPPPPPAPPPAATDTATPSGTPTASPTATPSPTSTPTVAVFVLAGQSNMLGGGGTTYDVPAAPEDAAIDEGPSIRWRLERLGPLVRVPWGPGLWIGRALVAAGVQRVGFVGCALSGSSIGQWAKGHPLYDDCLAAVRATGLPLAGVFFAQGEVDARTDGYLPPDGTPLNAAHWGDAFAAIVGDLRADLGQPDLPVVYGRLAHTNLPGRGNWALVQAQQDGLALARAVEVDPEPVDVTANDPHWERADYARQGERLAAAWLGMH